MRSGALIAILVIALTAGAAALVHRSTALAESQKKSAPIKIQWLIAHEPVSLFDRAEQVFVDEFNKDSDGSVEIQLLGPKDFGSTTGHLNQKDIMAALDSGQVQLATAVTTGLSNTTAPQLGVLTLPFLFKNETTAGQVLDGPIGQELLASVAASSTARALAFTFSGGLMVIESNNKQIHSVADLRGMRIATINGPISVQTLDSLGAIAVPLDPGKGVAATIELLDQYDGIETPYTRIFPDATSTVPKYVNETGHSFYLTTILVSDSFYASLTAQDQQALQKAAQAAAITEREDSIALKEKNRALLQVKGTTIVTMSPDAAAAFKTKAVALYPQFAPAFGADLIQRIIDAQQ